MTDDKLKRANKIKETIRELKLFVNAFSNTRDKFDFKFVYSSDGLNGNDYRTFDLPETEREYLYKAVIAEADKRIAELNKEFESL